jgi:PAS domain S-box-containing protein
LNESNHLNPDKYPLYKDFFQNSIVGFHLFDQNQVIIDINNHELEMLGYRRDEIVNKKRWSDLIAPGQNDQLEDHWRKIINGSPVQNYEYEVVRKDGRHIHVLLNASARYDSGGNIINTRGIVIDISVRKQLEEEVNRRAQELSAANHYLESFSYSVSHDIRGPLQIISGFTGLLMEDETLGMESRDYLNRINNGVTKLRSLIDDMLKLGGIGRHEMKREDAGLTSIVRDYLAELKNTDPLRKVNVIIQENVHAFADVNLIHLALENLLRNAWKFTVKKEMAVIEFGTQVRDAKQVYFIRDNGVGFDMKFAEKIFEPFKRLHEQEGYQGSGVGLSIVQRVIMSHGGRLWAESEPGMGATFYFTFD